MPSIVSRVALIVAALALLAGCDVTNPAGRPGGATTATVTAAPEPTATLQGVVQLAEVAPDQNAGVTVFLAGTGYQARTDTDGSYRITGVPRGEYNIIAEKQGYQTLTIDRIALDPERHKTDSPAVVRSAVLEKTGGDGDGATTGAATRMLGGVVGNVYLQGQDDSDGVRVQLDGTMYVTVSDRDGSYRLMNVEPGRYTVSFSYPGYRTFSTQVTIQRGGVARVDEAALERMAPATPARGATGTPTADAVATAPLSRTELTGTRAIAGLVEIRGPDGQPDSDFGRVTVALDNSDIVVTPDAQGTFRIPNLPPGLYKVTAALDGAASTMQSQVADLTTQESAQVTFRFGTTAADEGTTGTGRVTGTIVLGAPPSPQGGTPIAPPGDAAGVNIGLSGTQNVMLTGRDGIFTLENVPAGVYTLIASKDGYQDLELPNVRVTASQTVDVGELTMEPTVEYPRVLSTVPEQGARNVLVAETLIVVIKFSKPMDRDSLLRSIRITPPANFSPFLGRGAHPQAADDTLVLVLSNADPARPIRYNTNYRISILSTAADLTGVTMREEFTLSFSTGGIGVASTYPPDGGTNMVVDQTEYPVQIIFNGPMDLGSLNSDTIRLRPDNNETYRVDSQVNPVTGFTAARIMATYQPDTQYTVTVTRRVRTANGQPLSNAPYTFRFRSFNQEIIPLPDPVVR